MDVETAFLNGILEEEIFMEIPEGLKIDKNNNLKLKEEINKQEIKTKNNKVLKLIKSIYGLKQSPRCWNKRITKFLENEKYNQSKADPCVFIKENNKKEKTIIAIYVDDCFIIGKIEEIKKIKEIFNKEFKMKDNGELSGFLGINVNRNNNELTLDQEFYIENMLKKFSMQDCKPVTTPMVAEKKNKIITKKEKEKEGVETIKYQSAIGSLIYLSVATRPDIAYAVNQAAQAMKSPTDEDWVKIKRIFRYLQGTKTMKIRYTKEENEKENQTVGFSDASYAEDRKNRKSTSGYIFLKSNGPISWKSKKQPIVSLSSMEAEYIALTSASKEALWIRKLDGELEKEQTITINEDNQSAIKTANDEIHNERSKHIDVRYHFIREAIKQKLIKLAYLQTTSMLADALTKPLGAIQLEKLNKDMGLIQ
jgi:hypothetical protein